MILRRFYDEQLAQASYLVACAASGEAVVIDPTRDVLQYIEVARSEGVGITHVTETHIHADFVSGARELAQRAHAHLLLSGEGGPDWSYAFADADGATLLHDGDCFRIGNIRIDVVHTPGHTPEHLTFVVTDGAAADEPMGAATGDFLFVGDVGRPDLLEKAAGVAGTMEAGARTLFRSLERFRASYPEWLQIWPGHGAGSACGKGLSAVPHSTLGYEARFNWALNIRDEDAFVSAVLAGQPEPPKYFAQMKRINRDGPRVLGGIPQPSHVDATRLEDVLRAGTPIVDTRAADAYAEAHVPGTINIPLNRSFTNWAGSLLPYDQDLYLLTVSPATACDATRDLTMIGLDRVAGYFTADAVHTWASVGHPTGRLARISADALAERLRTGEVTVLDVRGRAEYAEGHLPGVLNIPLPELPDRLDDVPDTAPLVVHCETGSRSAIAASVLKAHGHRDVSNFVGGYAEWARSGRPTERGAEAAATA